jgi:hypothetical protein
MLKRGAIEHIAGDTQRAAAYGFNFSGDGFNLLSAARAGRNIGAGAGHAESDFPAQAGCPANDDGNLAGEIEKTLTHGSSPSAGASAVPARRLNGLEHRRLRCKQ